MKKILITGGAGFIGSHIADLLIKKSYQVVIVDNLSSGKTENLNSQATFYQGDICDLDFLEEVFEKEKPQIVSHHAAQINVRTSLENPQFDAEVNIKGSLNLLELSKKHKIQKFIFASTGGAIYGDTDNRPTPENQCPKPVSPYGIAKFSIENYLHYYNIVWGLNYTALRYSNVYGPRQNPHGEAGVVSIFLDKIKQNEICLINGTGTQTRDYVFVEDVARANLKAIESSFVGSLNVGTAQETSVNQLFETISNNLKKTVESQYRDGPKGEQQTSCLNYQKIQKELGWEPKVNLEKGIQETLEFFKVV